MARSLLRSTCTGWFERCRESRLTSPRVPRQGSSPAYFRLEAASPLKRRSQGLSCVIGNFHAQFLEGWTGAIPSGYSVNRELSRGASIERLRGPDCRETEQTGCSMPTARELKMG